MLKRLPERTLHCESFLCSVVLHLALNLKTASSTPPVLVRVDKPESFAGFDYLRQFQPNINKKENLR